jgi:hypothetical protein
MVSTVMRIQQALIVCAAALVVSTSTSYAGPCSKEIARFRAEINAKQPSNVGAAPSAPQTTGATMHRQPTPQKVEAAMAAASESDRAGDQMACKAALADAWRALRQ